LFLVKQGILDEATTDLLTNSPAYVKTVWIIVICKFSQDDTDSGCKVKLFLYFKREVCDSMNVNLLFIKWIVVKYDLMLKKYKWFKVCWKYFSGRRLKSERGRIGEELQLPLGVFKCLKGQVFPKPDRCSQVASLLGALSGSCTFLPRHSGTSLSL
jgi:hypothetical protein